MNYALSFEQNLESEWSACPTQCSGEYLSDMQYLPVTQEHIPIAQEHCQTVYNLFTGHVSPFVMDAGNMQSVDAEPRLLENLPGNGNIDSSSMPRTPINLPLSDSRSSERRHTQKISVRRKRDLCRFAEELGCMYQV